MRLILALCVLVCARPGPNIASRAFVAESGCTIKLSTNAKRCPESIVCEIGHQLPDPGHSIKQAKPAVDHKTRRIRIDLKMHRKPGAWPQVTVPTKTKVDLGTLRKGRYVVEVWRNERVLHAFLLDAR
ncbi:MAG: hypothetical protein ACYTHK_01780 [Planctomycetota bacterium]|jgi:hypothetical protein